MLARPYSRSIPYFRNFSTSVVRRRPSRTLWPIMCARDMFLGPA